MLPSANSDSNFGPISTAGISTAGIHKLRLVRPDEEPDDTTLPAIPIIPRYTSIEEKFLSTGWRSLSHEERASLLEAMTMLWGQLTAYQKNCLVVEAMGGTCQGGAVPLWSTSPQMMIWLRQYVQQDLFHLDEYCDILYIVLSANKGFGYEDTGLAMLDPHQRALHFFTLFCGTGPDIVSFAFVMVYHTQGLLSQARMNPKTPTPGQTEPIPTNA